MAGLCQAQRALGKLLCACRFDIARSVCPWEVWNSMFLMIVSGRESELLTSSDDVLPNCVISRFCAAVHACTEISHRNVFLVPVRFDLCTRVVCRVFSFRKLA